jgi:hypothetical protein
MDTVSMMDLGWLSGEEQPLAGRAFLWAKSWDETALGHRDAFEEGLLDVGLPGTAIREVIGLRDDVAVATKR